MGKLCSKCYKPKFKPIENKGNNLLYSDEEVKLPQPKTTIREEIVCKVGPVKLKENDNEEIFNKEKKSEEGKDPKIDIFIEVITSDDYFTPEQEKFYKSLYETELYDKPDLKLVKKYLY
jgi:hypothetical protein